MTREKVSQIGGGVKDDEEKDRKNSSVNPDESKNYTRVTVGLRIAQQPKSLPYWDSKDKNVAEFRRRKEKGEGVKTWKK